MVGGPYRLIWLVILLSTPMTAISQALDPVNLVTERPDPPGTATPVDIAFFLLDIDSIDDVQQRFSIDMFLRVTWKDTRLALPEDQRNGRLRQFSLDQIWTPRETVVNDRGLDLQLPLSAVVDDLGNVRYLQRMSGELAARLKFREFPFDRQRLEIDFVSYIYSPDEIQFTSNTLTRGDSEAFTAVGWRFAILEPTVGEFRIASEDIHRARLTFGVEAERNARYFLLTMLLPMSLIVFMAWTVFWLQPDIVPPRISIATAAIFSLIAFGFSMRLSVPPVSYMTRADVFVLGCTLLVFLALGVAVIGSRWAKSDRLAQALKVNAVARWLYAGSFVIVVIVALNI